MRENFDDSHHLFRTSSLKHFSVLLQTQALISRLLTPQITGNLPEAIVNALEYAVKKLLLLDNTYGKVATKKQTKKNPGLGTVMSLTMHCCNSCCGVRDFAGKNRIMK
jgi:hypothetical protein